MAMTCPVHKKAGVVRDMRGATPEQKWCGTWYDCTEPRCGWSGLEPSAELAKDLAKQKGKTAR